MKSAKLLGETRRPIGRNPGRSRSPSTGAARPGASTAFAIAAVAAVSASMAFASPARAQSSDVATRDAAAHFRQGVALYSEADYRAALVEFRRAWALAPNTAVLYNIGETQYELQDYASALVTFQRYLAESGPGDPHRAEVEQSLVTLRARVGHLTIVTLPPGADVAVDDQPVGKTPLPEPVLVNIGHRRVVVVAEGRSPVTRYVDMATDDNLTLTIPLAPQDARPAPALPPVDLPPPSTSSASAWRTAGWIATPVLGLAAGAFGVLALHESSVLKNARGTYPTSTATLNHDASLTLGYSVAADVLAVAAIALGGITLYSTLSARTPQGTQSPGAAVTETPRVGARVSVGPGSARVELTF